ncbi:S-adenosyl-L-methionine-dependent methyltransferase [Thozetella sp. PMI_491]|nr:S-adenosyl-L-methionine-dependent methyltransferase [Thozetella sp. PMI_491]
MAAPAHQLRSPEELDACFLKTHHNQAFVKHYLPAMTNRQNLVKSWGVAPGSKVLEIGCGQGDMTIVLADAVGPSGKVVAVDPGPADYGTPPLGEAQAFVLSSPVGKQIEFVRADPHDYLAAFAEPEPFDYIVFSYCIAYFPTPETLPKTLSLARKHTTASKLLIAEHSLSTRRPNALPHLLAVLTVNVLESFRDDRFVRNIGVLLSPAQIKGIAAEAGWALEKEELLEPTPGVQDGLWEAKMATGPKKRFEQDVEALDVPAKAETMLYTLQEAVRASVERVEGGLEEAGENMDVWAGRFTVVEKQE